LKEAIPFREKLKDAIVVKALVSDAPQIVSDGMSAPSLEKTLVDLVADRAFFGLDDDALHKEYQRAFEVYPVRKDRMLRYAGRRGVTEEVRAQIGKVDSYRVEMIGKIQCTLAKQPVVRAWLFGSWSRMEERPDSDIDLLVKFDNSDSISLLDYAGYMLDIEDNTGKKIDYVEDGRLLPFAQSSANHDKYIIYERTN
jgi:predicted nucleotidyltransferase